MDKIEATMQLSEKINPSSCAKKKIISTTL
jgi:hypothetical protein